MDDEQLVPLSEDEPPSGFDVVLRGYDRRQVDDYLDRVEAALNDADARHAEDAQRLAALERQVTDMHERLADAERRAAGMPEPAPVSGERIATMLRLAEEEAAEIRSRATQEAEQTLPQAQVLAGQETAKRTAELDRREQDIAAVRDQADAAKLKAEQDAEETRRQAKQAAEAIRTRATEEADAMRHKAQEELRQMHEAGQLEAAAMTAEARRQVEELSRQRDAIAAQLQSLRDTLAGAVGPLSAPVPTGDDVQAIQLPGDEARTEPSG